MGVNVPRVSTGFAQASTSDGKADTDVKREMREAAMRYDRSTALPLRDVVLGELKNGVRPEWIAVKYGHLGATLERVMAFKAAIDKQQEKQRERQNAARGNQESLEVGAVPDGIGSS